MSNLVPPKPLNCVICNKHFYGRSDAKTCSGKCRQALRRKLIKGSNND